MGEKLLIDPGRCADLKKEYYALKNDMRLAMVRPVSSHEESVKRLLKDAIKDWPYREGAVSIFSYMRRKLKGASYSKEEQIICRLELFVNLLYWIPDYDRLCARRQGLNSSVSYWNSVDGINTGTALLKENLARHIDNIHCILEKCGLEVKKIGKEAGVEPSEAVNAEKEVNRAEEGNRNESGGEMPTEKEILASVPRYIIVSREGGI